MVRTVTDPRPGKTASLTTHRTLVHRVAAIARCCACGAAQVTDLFDIIERYAANQPEVENVYISLDLLCSNHHGGSYYHGGSYHHGRANHHGSSD